jgi:hypothetical protein
MPTELQLQAELVKACKEAGGFGYKQSNKFLAGPPDLYLSHEATGPVFIEVKLNDPSSKVANVTPLQTDTIQRMQKAGSRCAVCVLVPMPTALGGGYDIYMNTNPTKLKLDDSWIHIVKKRGDKWPIQTMMLVCADSEDVRRSVA